MPRLIEFWEPRSVQLKKKQFYSLRTHRQHSKFVCKRHNEWVIIEMINVKLSELKQDNELLPYLNLFDFCLWNAETNLLSALRSLKRLSRAHHWINLVQILAALLINQHDEYAIFLFKTTRIFSLTCQNEFDKVSCSYFREDSKFGDYSL